MTPGAPGGPQKNPLCGSPASPRERSRNVSQPSYEAGPYHAAADHLPDDGGGHLHDHQYHRLFHRRVLPAGGLRLRRLQSRQRRLRQLPAPGVLPARRPPDHPGDDRGQGRRSGAQLQHPQLLYPGRPHRRVPHRKRRSEGLREPPDHPEPPHRPQQHRRRHGRSGRPERHHRQLYGRRHPHLRRGERLHHLHLRQPQHRQRPQRQALPHHPPGAAGGPAHFRAPLLPAQQDHDHPHRAPHRAGGAGGGGGLRLHH